MEHQITKQSQVFSLGFSLQPTSPECRHPPHVPFAPGSSYLLDVLAPMPLPFLFIVLSLFVLCFFWFCADLPISYAPVSSLSFHCRAFFRAPTATSFQHASQYSRICLHAIGFFLVFPFACICFFIFSLYFCLFFSCNNSLVSLVRLDPLWS